MGCAAGLACALTLLACACSESERPAIAIRFVHDQTLNSMADVRAALRVIELKLDAAGGLGVATSGRYGAWQATDTDGDSDLELVAALVVPEGASLPPYRLLQGAALRGPFDITARGRNEDGSVVAAGAAAQAKFDALNAQSVELPLDLLGPYRAPRVVASQPADGEVLDEPPAKISVTFSRVIDERTVGQGLRLVSEDGSQVSGAGLDSWTIATQNVPVFGVETLRSVAQLLPSESCQLVSGRYRLEAGSSIQAEDGKGLDQQAHTPSAQGYVASFTLSKDGSCAAKSCRSPSDCRESDDPRVFACIGRGDMSQLGTCVALPEGCIGAQDCPPEYTCGESGSCIAVHCGSGVLDGDESDEDCGGSCKPCERGQRCGGDEDCSAADSCTADGVCGAPASCSNGARDGDETDIDCGGSCGPCQRGQLCSLGQDCAAPDTCTADGTCGLPASCANGNKDEYETDVDCGGSCDPCARGQRCERHGDCESEAVCGTGSGAVCKRATSCARLLAAHSDAASGVYQIRPLVSLSPISVYCDMQSDGGGWTLVLLNSPYRWGPRPLWSQATAGNTIRGSIGDDLDGAFDQLVGLQYWPAMGSTLRVEVGSTRSDIAHRAEYAFSFGSSRFSLQLSNQRILIGQTAPDLFTRHNGAPFSTYDRDNDEHLVLNCSMSYGHMAWWYRSCWDGSFWGPGDYPVAGAPVGAHWTGRLTDPFAWGAMWVR